MKKQLLTLKQKVQNCFNDNTKTAYSVLVDLRRFVEFLDLPLTLSQFIPCDSEGKPLEKPSNYDKWKECEEHGLELFFSNENECKAYEQALKAVIFEGFEVKFSSKIDFILSNSQYEIGFYKVKEGFVVKILEDSQIVSAIKSLQTISDLADATSENPINLR